MADEIDLLAGYFPLSDSFRSRRAPSRFAFPCDSLRISEYRALYGRATLEARDAARRDRAMGGEIMRLLGNHRYAKSIMHRCFSRVCELRGARRKQ